MNSGLLESAGIFSLIVVVWFGLVGWKLFGLFKPNHAKPVRANRGEN